MAPFGEDDCPSGYPTTTSADSDTPDGCYYTFKEVIAISATLAEPFVLDPTSLSSCTASFEADQDFVAMQLNNIAKMTDSSTAAYSDDGSQFTGEFVNYYAASADVIGAYVDFLANTMPSLVDACSVSFVVVSTHIIDTLADCGISTTGTFTIDSTVNGDVPEIACAATTTADVTDAPAVNTTAATNATTTAPADSSAGGFSFTMLSALALASLAEF